MTNAPRRGAPLIAVSAISAITSDAGLACAVGSFLEAAVAQTKIERILILP